MGLGRDELLRWETPCPTSGLVVSGGPRDRVVVLYDRYQRPRNAAASAAMSLRANVTGESAHAISSLSSQINSIMYREVS